MGLNTSKDEYKPSGGVSFLKITQALDQPKGTENIALEPFRKTGLHWFRGSLVGDRSIGICLGRLIGEQYPDIFVPHEVALRGEDTQSDYPLRWWIATDAYWLAEREGGERRCTYGLNMYLD